MVDPDLVRRKLAEIDVYLGQLAEYRSVTVAEYRADWKTQRIVERTLQMAIETCLDVAGHVIADRGLPVPATYAETFEVLGEAGLLDPALRDAMVGMAGFRNVVVHDYAAVDAGIVVRILRERLPDLGRFQAAARAWV